MTLAIVRRNWQRCGRTFGTLRPWGICGRTLDGPRQTDLRPWFESRYVPAIV